MSDLHEVVFRWPYNAKEVIVTGTFDQWSRSVRLNKGQSGFSATVRVPWAEKVLYKFVVDSRWTTIDQAPTEADWRGNINNIYYAPTKPQEVDTPRYEKPVAQKPVIAPVPAPVPVEEKKQDPTPTPQPTKQDSVKAPAKPEEPVKDRTPVVDKKEPSSNVDGKGTSSVPGVTTPAPVVPVNDTKPVDTPPSKTNNPPAVLPTPANLKAPLVIVPVNDASTVDKRPPVTDLPHTEIPSTHTPLINNSRRSSAGTSSSNNTLPSEKKAEEKKEPKPEEVKQPNGTGNSTVKAEPAEQPPPSTPVKSKTPTLPTTPATQATFSSPPTTPKKPHFPRSRSSGSSSSSSSSSSNSSKSGSWKRSLRKKRDSIVTKVKRLLTPEKDKGKKEHKREKSHG